MLADGAIGSVAASRLRVEAERLREVILFDQRRRILVRAAVYRRERTREVAVRGRRRGLPLERVRLPGIPLGPAAGDQGPEEVHDEDQLRGTEAERADGDDHVDVLQRLQ